MPLSKFCRIELMTTDAGAAARFYTAVFGWRADAEALPDGGVYYWLSSQDGRALGGLYAMPADLARGGVAPHWLPHVGVADVDERGSAAQALGARLTASGFAVLGRGRLALLQDPTGAPFGVWTAAGVAGPADVTPAFWCELSTADPAAAARFYAGLLGWEAHRHDAGAPGFTTLHAGADVAAGLLAIGPGYDRVPSHWLVYVRVADAQASADAAQAAGGRILAPPGTAPGLGRQAVVQDPQGAVIGLVEALAFH